MIGRAKHSYLQSTVQVILDPATGEKLCQRLTDLGVQATLRKDL